MGIELKLEYIPTVPGILKIAEIILLLLAFSCAASFNNGTVASHLNYSSVEYFVAISVIIWIFALAMFVLGLLGIMESIRIPRKGFLVGIVHAVLAFLLLIGACVAAAEDPPCTFVSPGCSTLRAGVAFGFFAFIALVADTVFYIFTEWRGMTTHTSSSSGGGPPPSEVKDANPV